MADILTALRNACTANGWTLSGNVLHKGTCFVNTRVATCVASAIRPAVGVRDYLMVKSGNGKDGSNLLTDPSGNEPCIGPLLNGGNATTLAFIDWSFPVDYHIHINTSPDEVWLVVQYNSAFFQHVGFGQSPGIGNPGTGNWHFATLGSNAVNSSQQSTKQFNAIECGNAGANVGFNARENIVPQPFWTDRWAGSDVATAAPGEMNYSYHGMRGDTGAAAWSSSGNGYGLSYVVPATGTGASAVAAPLLARQPNAWNGESSLIPLQLAVRRPDSKMSIQGELKHVRTLRMDFLDPLFVIDLSPDKWRVYPVFNKNTVAPAGGTNLGHSGCFAVAIHYDGP